MYGRVCRSCGGGRKFKPRRKHYKRFTPYRSKPVFRRRR